MLLDRVRLSGAGSSRGDDGRYGGGVARMPAGVHHPGRRPFDDPAAGQNDEPEEPRGRRTVLTVRLKCFTSQSLARPASWHTEAGLPHRFVLGRVGQTIFN
ncbi:hypothetical protein [Streptomyces platensis]|uniref:hypothetical protein n=1 Tax=Streptomyces platensis TaxID=58346 RepID=UPI00386FCEB4|nr:hypothetical protein OG962_36555 [Streptomyces platensis]